MQLEISALSKPGGRDPNEDALGFWSEAGVCLCVVSDGAGGHGGGDVASKLAVHTILGRFRESPDCTVQAVERALREANQAIIARQRTGDVVADMRATAVVVAIDAGRPSACWGHLGDSRLYAFRHGRVIVQTRDHSVVQRMVDAGYLRMDQLRQASERSRLFAALGHEENFEPALSEPAFPIEHGDAFMLCTDGFWEHVDEHEMEQALAEATSAEAWLQRMELQVVARGGKGQDNYSALAVWCSAPSAIVPPVGDADPPPDRR
jgi:PPM family protein phosphatase